MIVIIIVYKYATRQHIKYKHLHKDNMNIHVNTQYNETLH